MGCGKSTAAAIFADLGFSRIDADDQVKHTILRLPEVMERIRGRFGTEVFAANGSVDRAVLGKRVFADDEARLWLENEVHPRVFAAWREALRSAPTQPRVFDVPLLFEQRLENWFDFTVCVATSSAAQLARLEKRGVPSHVAAPRISKQLPLARKIELADYVLSNDGSREFLRTQIVRLIAQLR